MKHLPDENQRENRPATVLMVLFVCVWLLFFAMDQEEEAVETSAVLTGTESQELLSEEAGDEDGFSSGGTASKESSVSAPENGEGSELTADDSGRLPSYLGASLFDSSREWTKELQADRDRLLRAQLSDDFRIPMRLDEGFGRLPVWKGSYDCGTLLFPLGQLTGAGEASSGANAGRTEEDTENLEESERFGGSVKNTEQKNAGAGKRRIRIWNRR